MRRRAETSSRIDLGVVFVHNHVECLDSILRDFGATEPQRVRLQYEQFLLAGACV